MSKSAARHRPAARRKPTVGVWAILGLAAILLVAAALVWQNQTAASSAAYPLEVSVPEAAALRDSGAFLLDVREVDEWNDYHVPGSTLIPLGSLQARVGELPREAEIVVVCRSGNRSASGRDILLAAGFTRVTSLAGGLSEWRASGYPTVSGP
jgi:rhodanese-related sulfurtransferase